MVVGAHQSFQFFRQNTWFLENNRVLSKSLYGILYYLISIIKQYKNHSIKPNFILTTRTTLNHNDLCGRLADLIYFYTDDSILCTNFHVHLTLFVCTQFAKACLMYFQIIFFVFALLYYHQSFLSLLLAILYLVKTFC